MVNSCMARMGGGRTAPIASHWASTACDRRAAHAHSSSAAATPPKPTKHKAMSHLFPISLAREMGNRWLIALCFVGFGGVAAAEEEWAWAARLSHAVDAQCEAIGAVLPPPIRAMHEFTITAARTQLGEEAFRAVWAEGRTMTPEQALAASGVIE